MGGIIRGRGGMVREGGAGGGGECMAACCKTEMTWGVACVYSWPLLGALFTDAPGMLRCRERYSVVAHLAPNAAASCRFLLYFCYYYFFKK